MRLILKNYGIHKSREFNLPDSGFVLLCGVNGTGKTTMLSAICFALYGNQQKVVSRYEKTATVILEFEGMKIERHVPAKLTVTYDGVVLTGDAAQHTINTVMGMNCEVFGVSSCIVQRCLKNSVISMSPTEQLAFIEDIATANANCDHEKNRKMIHSLVVKTEKDLVLAKRAYENSKCKYDVLKESCPEKVELPFLDKISTKQELAQAIDTLSARAKAHASELQKLTAKQNEYLSTENLRKDIEQKIKMLEFEMERISTSIREVTDEEIKALEDELAQTKARLAATVAYNNHKIEHLKARELKNSFLASQRAKRESLKEIIPSQEDLDALIADIKRLDALSADFVEYTKQNHIYEHNKVQNDELYSAVCNKFNIPFSNHDDILKSLLSLLEKARRAGAKHTNCPACKVPLVITHAGELEIEIAPVLLPAPAAQIPKKRGRQPKKKVVLIPEPVEANPCAVNYEESLLMSYINKLDGCKLLPKPDKVNYVEAFHVLLKNRYAEIQSAQAELAEMLGQTKPNYPPHVIAAYKSLKRLEARVPSGLVPTDEEEETLLKDKANALAVELGMLTKTKAIYMAQMKDYKRKEKEVSELSAKIRPRHLSQPKNDGSILKEIENKTAKLQKDKSEMDELWKLVHIFDKHESYVSCLEKIALAEAETNLSFTKLTQAEGAYTGALTLENLYKEKEYQALERIIDIVNEQARVHLDALFNEFIVVKLSSKKVIGNGDTKMQMNTMVDYRCDDKKKLCGGETQKCELSYIMGVNEMFNGRLLFLDECANSVDKAANMELLIYIREWCKNSNSNGMKKLVFSVGHEAVTGVFDEIVYF